jgi:hypothetical protein
MMRLVQICASQNDLFGLDSDGRVYRYNFKASTWTRLGQGRGDPGESSPVEGQTSSGEPKTRVTITPAKG